MHEGQFADSDANLCGICQREPKSGLWELCGACRYMLRAKHAVFVATARPPACMGCAKPRPADAPPGCYCSRCAARWGSRS